VKQYDYKGELMYKELDDCLLGFIDSVAVKRFMNKCGIQIEDSLLIAIIRRLDLNADAKLSKREFMDAVTPIEGKQVKLSVKRRPKTGDRYEVSKMP
jgi:hypothetical protein